jgi:hypothetical protein
MATNRISSSVKAALSKVAKRPSQPTVESDEAPVGREERATESATVSTIPDGTKGTRIGKDSSTDVLGGAVGSPTSGTPASAADPSQVAGRDRVQSQLEDAAVARVDTGTVSEANPNPVRAGQQAAGVSPLPTDVRGFRQPGLAADGADAGPSVADGASDFASGVFEAEAKRAFERLGGSFADATISEDRGRTVIQSGDAVLLRQGQRFSVENIAGEQVLGTVEGDQVVIDEFAPDGSGSRKTIDTNDDGSSETLVETIDENGLVIGRTEQRDVPGGTSLLQEVLQEIDSATTADVFVDVSVDVLQPGPDDEVAPIPDEIAGSLRSQLGPLQEAGRRANDPTGGDTDPVDDGGIAPISSATGPLPDAKGRLLGGNVDPGDIVGAGGSAGPGAVANSPTQPGAVRPNEGDDVAPGTGPEDDPLASAPSVESEIPTGSQGQDDDEAAPAVSLDPAALAGVRATRPGPAVRSLTSRDEQPASAAPPLIDPIRTDPIDLDVPSVPDLPDLVDDATGEDDDD